MTGEFSTLLVGEYTGALAEMELELAYEGALAGADEYVGDNASELAVP